MKFIVTGGAGFIGHNVVRQLEAQGHQCFIIDKCTTYGFVPKEELNYLKNERKKRIHGNVHHIDLRDHKAISNFFLSFGNRVDAVIHLASFPRQKVVSANPVWGSEVMSTGLIHLLEETRKNNIPKFVYISSSMVYGDFDNDVKESYNCNPQGQYGIMKLAGEWLVKDYARKTGMEYVIIRPSAVYGPLDVEDRVVAKFMLGAMRGHRLRVNGAGETLDFTYVDDIVEGVIKVLLYPPAERPTPPVRIFNLGHNRPVETLLFVRMLEQLLGKTARTELLPAQPGDMFETCADLTRIRSAINFSPRVSLEEGLRRFVAWFREYYRL